MTQQLTWGTPDVRHLTVRYFRGSEVRRICYTIVFCLILVAAGIALSHGVWGVLMILLFLFYWHVILPAPSALNYFGVAARYLVIKNHNLPWKQRVFYLKDITAVEIASAWNVVRYLKITTRDQKTRRYIALNLRGEDWDALKLLLTNLGLNVQE